MSIKLTFDGLSAADAVRLITTYEPTTPETTSAEPAVGADKSKRTRKAAETPAAKPTTAATPPVAPVAAPVAAPAATAPIVASAVTLGQLSDRITALARAKGREAAASLLQGMGVNRTSELKPEKYDEALAKINAILNPPTAAAAAPATIESLI